MNRSELSALGFPEPINVLGRSSVADLYKKTRRCGIYVLCFSDGWFYVGQAQDVVKRFSQHCKTHTDIDHITFKKIAKSKLNDVEKDTIAACETKGAKLRNIALISIPYWSSDFDGVMMPDEQKSWLELPTTAIESADRRFDENLRVRNQKKHEKLQQSEHYDGVTTFMREYLHKCIPSVIYGEGIFWCCSVHPSNKDLVRINLYLQEVLTIRSLSNDLFFAFQVAKSKSRELCKGYLSSFRIRLKIPSLRVYDHVYKSGGQDQTRLVVRGIDDAMRLLDNQLFIVSAKEMNMRLSRKGACINARSHCMTYVDQLI